MSYEFYDGMAPHNKTDTSIAAAKEMTPRAKPIREQVFDLLSSARDGMTCDEVEVALSRPHTTVSARIRELVLVDKIMESVEESGIILQEKLSNPKPL